MPGTVEVGVCVACGHPAKLHINGICSTAKCYCTENVAVEVLSNAHWYGVVNVNGDQVTLEDPRNPNRGEHWERNTGSVIIELANHSMEPGDKVLLAIIAHKKG